MSGDVLYYNRDKCLRNKNELRVCIVVIRNDHEIICVTKMDGKLYDSYQTVTLSL